MFFGLTFFCDYNSKAVFKSLTLLVGGFIFVNVHPYLRVRFPSSNGLVQPPSGLSHLKLTRSKQINRLPSDSDPNNLHVSNSGAQARARSKRLGLGGLGGR